VQRTTKAHVSHATKSNNFITQRNFVAQQSCLGNCQFSIGKHCQTYMASSDTDDDIIISSALLSASTLYQRRQVNVRKLKRNSEACKQTTDQSQLGDRARNCRRMNRDGFEPATLLFDSSKVG